MSSKSKKILIIEDEAFLSEMYKTKFDSLGYEVVTADNGDEGLAKLRQTKPDIVLLDIIMPVVDGYSVLKTIRSEAAIKDTLVVIFSNLGQEEEIKKGLQLGADDYLVKSSLTPTELVAKVEKVLALGRSTKSETIKKIRVLIIEDTKDIIDIYTKKFDDEGFDYKVAENGAWGLKLAQDETWDVIILDLMMPAMDGITSLDTIRETPKLKNTPIIVLSNSIEADEMAPIKEHGATEIYLKARVTPTQISTKIRELVER
jgi:DNA-binding response OmpR family regulator